MKSEPWKENYIDGAANEMYSAKLSESFFGMSFAEVSK